MRFEIVADKKAMAVVPTTERDIQQLENAFGLKADGDSITLVRRKVFDGRPGSAGFHVVLERPKPKAKKPEVETIKPNKKPTVLVPKATKKDED